MNNSESLSFLLKESWNKGVVLMSLLQQENLTEKEIDTIIEILEFYEKAYPILKSQKTIELVKRFSAIKKEPELFSKYQEAIKEIEKLLYKRKFFILKTKTVYKIIKKLKETRVLSNLIRNFLIRLVSLILVILISFSNISFAKSEQVLTYLLSQNKKITSIEDIRKEYWIIQKLDKEINFQELSTTLEYAREQLLKGIEEFSITVGDQKIEVKIINDQNMAEGILANKEDYIGKYIETEEIRMIVIYKYKIKEIINKKIKNSEIKEKIIKQEVINTLEHEIFHVYQNVNYINYFKYDPINTRSYFYDIKNKICTYFLSILDNNTETIDKIIKHIEKNEESKKERISNLKEINSLYNLLKISIKYINSNINLDWRKPITAEIPSLELKDKEIQNILKDNKFLIIKEGNNKITVDIIYILGVLRSKLYDLSYNYLPNTSNLIQEYLSKLREIIRDLNMAYQVAHIMTEGYNQKEGAEYVFTELFAKLFETIASDNGKQLTKNEKIEVLNCIINYLTFNDIEEAKVIFTYNPYEQGKILGEKILAVLNTKGICYEDALEIALTANYLIIPRCTNEMKEDLVEKERKLNSKVKSLSTIAEEINKSSI